VGLASIHIRNTTSWNDSCVTNESNPWRLPQTAVVPLHYDLDLSGVQLHPKWSFDGNVQVYVKVNQKTSCVEMHAEALDIKQIKLHEVELVEGVESTLEEPLKPVKEVKWDSFIEPTKFSIDFDHGFKLKMRFDRNLQKDAVYVIAIEYAAGVRTDLRGFYQSSYTADDDTKHYMGVTQFESVDARAAFPCFDEPSFKATFKVSITLEADNANDYAILSNTAVQKSTLNSASSKTVVFERTPRMSTYLLAWVVGELDSISSTVTVADRTVPVSLYAPLGQANKGQFALDTTVKVARALVDYWGMTESILGKLDVLAIPDFEAGAMENFGLITFRTAYLLLEDDATVGEQEGVALVIAHEMSHQLTGNVYTTAWWSSLFLNEGFANFFEHKLVEIAFEGSSFDPWKLFLTAVSQKAMAQDSLPTSHALVNSVNSSLEIDSMFSSITYDKGACVLRMLEAHMGAANFQTWVRNFAKAHRYESATPEDLIATLKQSFPDMEWYSKLSQWFNNAGYPVVNVHAEANNAYSLTQERFWSHEPIEGDVSRSSWWIPITYQSMDGAVTSTSMDGKTVVRFDSNLLTLNVDRKGFYRVNYPLAHWQKLSEHVTNNMDFNNGAMETMKLTTADRYGLVDDVLSLARAGNIRIGTAFEFLQSFKFEKELSVWEAIINHLYKIHIPVGVEASHEAFCRYVQDLLMVVYNRMGWSEKAGESMEDKRLRGLVLRAMVRFEYDHAIEEALIRFDNSSLAEIPGEMKQTILECVVTERGERGFLDVETRLKNSNSDSEKRTFAYALVAARKPSLIKRALQLVSGENLIRAQDGPFILRAAAQNIYAGDLTWDFVREYIEDLTWNYGERLVSNRLLPGVTSQFTSLVRYKEVESFLKKRPSFSTISLNIILDQIRENMHFIGYNLIDMKMWLESKGFHLLPFSN